MIPIIKEWEFFLLPRTFSGPSHPDDQGLAVLSLVLSNHYAINSMYISKSYTLVCVKERPPVGTNRVLYVASTEAASALQVTHNGL